jgi:hypothetical protein
MIKIEFPADRTDIAAAIGRALLEIGGVALNHSVRERIGDMEVETVTTTQPATGADNDAGEPKNRIIPHAEIEGDLRQLQAAADLREGLSVLESDIAIGTRPGSVFADPTETMQALGKDLDAADKLPQIDGKGVAFHAAFCGISAKPFYETGKTSGQWKRRRGVDPAAYDAWYAEQLANDSCESDTPVDTAPVDTAGAFPTTDTQPTEHTHAPTTCGDFMGWASKKQAAELLTQADITEAYAAAGLVITDLFPPNDDAVIAERVAVLYNALVSKAGA